MGLCCSKDCERRISIMGIAQLFLVCSMSALPTKGEDLLDCRTDPEWSVFRDRLQRNAEAGFPLDTEMVMQAQGLLEKYHDDLMLDPHSAYGASPGMVSFFRSCNSRPSPGGDPGFPQPFCLYGAVAALWVVARAGHPDDRRLLAQAQFLLGRTMRHTLDFMESSDWPISSLDIFANLQRGPEDPFRLPTELGQYRLTSDALASEIPSRPILAASESTMRITVWEVGVHASLSAEPLQMWARFVPGAKLVHRNLIQDQYPPWLPDKCATLYSHPHLTCDTYEDDITDLFRRHMPYSATSKDPIQSIDTLVSEFRSAAHSRLLHVDVLLCTVAYLCLLGESLGLPMLGYFGHPLLFMVPRDAHTRDDFWARFVSLAKSDTVGFAVSDPFLQMQYDYQVGSPRLPAIRTHALYTGVTHFPERPSEILVLDRPHECVLMCIIQRLLSARWTAPQRSRPTEPSHAYDEEWPTHDGRLRSAGSSAYPYRFLTRSLTDKSFATFAKFRAVALWAYDMDLITFYEFYSMNTPLFMPSHLPKYVFQQDHADYAGQWTGRHYEHGWPQLWPLEVSQLSPFEEELIDAVRLTVSFTDYFRFPEVQYFESIPDLLDKLIKADYFAIVQKMSRFNQDSLVESANAWRSLLRRTTGWDAELLML